MKTLFLDIASHQGCIACVSEDEVLGFEQCDTRISDDELVPLIEKVLQRAVLRTGRDVTPLRLYDALTHVACIIGPGGFTSLRVAVSCANTIADQIKIPSAGVHMSDYLFARTDQADVLWLHSTKKSELFVCGAKWKEPTHMEIDSFIKEAPKGAKWMGELIEEHQEAIIPLELEEVKLKIPEKILPKFLSQLEYTQDLLEPWYGRGF